MFVDFFIKRPVFASVCSLVILLAGGVSIPALPIAQYPEISPPQVQVSSTYIGANAQDVENAVTTVLEQQINGVQGMQYISSSSSNDGTSTITVTFEPQYNQDIGAVDVQNRVSIAEPQLPASVRQTGVKVTKQQSSILLGIGLYTDNNEYSTIFLSNYADLYLTNALKRVNGVGQVTIFGERKYAMRIWLDPARLASRGITAQDVVNAINQQNIQVGAGTIGQPPAPTGQMYQIPITAQSRLTKPTQFENIIVKTNTDGTLIKIKDLGRVELGAETYSSFLRFDGKDAVGLGIYQLPGSNALDVAKAVKAEMKNLAQHFPPGMKYEVAIDRTQFVQESIKEVLTTLFEAIALVVLVIFIFLQNWKTTLIPAITIPVSLIGTFAFMKVFGFSINLLSLFGITLATGLVVDDAIVVIENITRVLEAENVSPRRAASEGMHEVTGAVIASSLVLMAVFIPVAFFPGTTGELYKQFALTIAFSIGISAFNALTLTPALSALLLGRGEASRGWMSRIFRPINWCIDKTRSGYHWSLQRLTRIKGIVILIFIGLLVLTVWLYLHVPQAFIPEEDQGYFLTIIQAQQGVSLQYTSDVMAQVEKELLSLPEVDSTFAVGGFGFSGSTANNGIVFTHLKPWSERQKANQSAQAIIKKLQGTFNAIPGAKILPNNPPAIPGLGSFGGFQFELEDQRGNASIDTLVKNMQEIVSRANKTPNLTSVFSTFAANTPQLLVEVDRNKAEALQVSVQDIFNTMQTFLGSQYVNDFNLQHRTYRVYVEAEKQFRSNPQDIKQLYVRSNQGQMIPLGSLVKVTRTTGAETINHYNLFRSIEINGSAAPGSSSGQAIKAMQRIAKQVLPSGFGYEWSGISAQEIKSGGQAPLIFALGIVFVFLVLAAQYENYFDPLIILLAVPLAILGAMLAEWLRGFSNDVYSQIGLVMLIGLASKNAILIVEFANQLREKGLSTTKAVIEASQERLRPILMTAIAFILGIFPLVIASGAGAASRQSLGTAVVGGMFVSTFLSLFVVPVLYIVITNIRDRLNRGDKHKETSDPERNSQATSSSSTKTVRIKLKR
ncbi:MAG: efflux RND transporter permease subunit [Chroococcidiopsidaceae cyanobacterium CP_BM_ER_R8_30]|nr:efflux RND transporter permease subunit [Chroococcidiopsidaceae cyanobacterium CP_BM_ER_R8_30]